MVAGQLPLVGLQEGEVLEFMRREPEKKNPFVAAGLTCCCAATTAFS